MEINRVWSPALNLPIHFQNEARLVFEMQQPVWGSVQKKKKTLPTLTELKVKVKQTLWSLVVYCLMTQSGHCLRVDTVYYFHSFTIWRKNLCTLHLEGSMGHYLNFQVNERQISGLIFAIINSAHSES